MTHTKIPQTASLQELAQFWDTHDMTDFEDELEEVRVEDIFEKDLKECYEDQVGWYENKSTQYKRYYQWLQWGAIIISASVPVLIVVMPDRLKWITFILSIVLAVIIIVLKISKFEENWLNYRAIAELLKQEKYSHYARTIEHTTAKDEKQLLSKELKP